MPLAAFSLVSFPFTMNEQNEVYAVLSTMIIAMVILVAFGQYWQK